MAMYHRHVSLDKPNNVKYEYDMLIFLEYVKPEYINRDWFETFTYVSG